jgi:hypothetical protein
VLMYSLLLDAGEEAAGEMRIPYRRDFDRRSSLLFGRLVHACANYWRGLPPD